MAEKNYVDIENTEYLEFAVRDLKKASELYDKMGFEWLGSRTEVSKQTRLYGQGDVRILLTASHDDHHPVYQFTRKHGDGVIAVGIRVNDAGEAHTLATAKGATSLKPETTLPTPTGRGATKIASINTFGDTSFNFLSFSGGATLDDFFVEGARKLDGSKGRFFQVIDHVTVNVEKGKIDHWAKFFNDVFGFTQVRYFDISTGRTGLLSRALRSPSGRLTMPFNEPTEEKSQIQEFLNDFRGPGVQHVALHTSNIILALQEMMSRGFKFLTVPHTYYEALKGRLPNVKEDIAVLEKLGILVDGDDKGYLLQIFTEPLVGPFFYEYIQRKGNDGFGEGNFKALFEAIERDQMRRGVL